MPVTIKRPFDSNAKDPFEIQIITEESRKIILHAKDRPTSDRLLIALLDDLLYAETKP